MWFFSFFNTVSIHLYSEPCQKQTHHNYIFEDIYCVKGHKTSAEKFRIKLNDFSPRFELLEQSYKHRCTNILIPIGLGPSGAVVTII
jgi:hypothetical protein